MAAVLNSFVNHETDTACLLGAGVWDLPLRLEYRGPHLSDTRVTIVIRGMGLYNVINGLGAMWAVRYQVSTSGLHVFIRFRILLPRRQLRGDKKVIPRERKVTCGSKLAVAVI